MSDVTDLEETLFSLQRELDDTTEHVSECRRRMDVATDEYYDAQEELERLEIEIQVAERALTDRDKVKTFTDARQLALL